MLNRIAPDFKLGQGDVNFLSRNKDFCDECLSFKLEYGVNGGMIVHTAYRILEVQKKLMNELK